MGTASDNPFTHVHTFLCMYIHMCTICFHCVISLGTACGDSVFCCSGTASGDPCHFNLYHRTMYFCGHRQWRHFYMSTYIHLSFDFNATFLSGHRLCRRGFLFCHRITYICTYTFVRIGHRQWRPLSFHLISSHHFCWHCQWRPFHTHTHTHFI